MKRIMSIIAIVTLVLSQSTVASAAFGIDETISGKVATVDLSTGTPVADLALAFKTMAGAAATNITWTAVNLGDSWAKAANYLEVGYNANKIGWGVQIYTDNMTGANAYIGNPDLDPAQQPAGLIAQTTKDIACPVAILVEDAALTPLQLATPNLVISGADRWFDNGYNKDPGDADHENVWFYLKDKRSTLWNDEHYPDPDARRNNGIPDAGEMEPTFSATGDEVATIVNTYGFTTGWYINTTGKMGRDTETHAKDRAEGAGNTLIAGTDLYSLNVYFAADFSTATTLQQYETHTITLEIYHQ